MYGTRRSRLRYEGDRTFRALKVISKILKASSGILDVPYRHATRAESVSPGNKIFAFIVGRINLGVSISAVFKIRHLKLLMAYL